jgi:hypothetical protein
VARDSEPTDVGASPRPTVKVQCESCLTVVSTQHAWDNVTCACGSLTVSGRPWRPMVAWLATPGGGWTETTIECVDDADLDGGADAEGDATAPRPIGYRP